MASRLQAVVDLDGRVTMPYDDALAGLLVHGESNTARASHVEPGKLGIGWEVDMSPIDGPRLGLFMLREDALAAERDFLESPEGVALMVGRRPECVA